MKNIMNKISTVLKNRRVMYGLSSTLAVICLIAALVAINLLVDKMDVKVDLTKNKQYSASQKGIKYANTIRDKTNITVFFDSATDSTEAANQIKNVLSDYKKSNKNINIKYVDPDKNQVLVQQYSAAGYQVKNWSLVVESSGRTKVFDIQDYFNYDGSTGVRISSFEQKLVSAIGNVVGKEEFFAYCLSGHQEYKLQQFNKINTLVQDIYTVKDLNLISSDGVPQNAAAVLIIGPKVDIGSDEYTKLSKYLESGGSMLVCLEPGLAAPQLIKLLETYKITPVNDIVIEGDSSRYALGRPVFLIAGINMTEVTADIASENINVILFGCRSLNINKDAEKDGFTTYILAKSSNKSWGRTDFKNVKATKASDDIPGPLNLAVAVQKKLSDPKTNKRTRIVVFGDVDFMSDAFIEQGAGGNAELFVNAIKWAGEQQNIPIIDSKPMNLESFIPTNSQKTMMIVVVGLVPVLIALVGGVVWFRRRRL